MPASLGLAGVGVGGDPGARHDVMEFRGPSGGFPGQPAHLQSNLPTFQGTGAKLHQGMHLENRLLVAEWSSPAMDVGKAGKSVEGGSFLWCSSYAVYS